MEIDIPYLNKLTRKHPPRNFIFHAGGGVMALKAPFPYFGGKSSVPAVELVEASELSETARGTGGYGSTGK